MAVRIRLKRMGRTHRPFYRVCAMDSRSPRNGKAIERLGYYDPMVSEKDARVKLNNERVAYWLSVGALPTEKVKVLIAKYGPEGTHLEVQAEAFARVSANKPTAPPPEALPSFDELCQACCQLHRGTCACSPFQPVRCFRYIQAIAST